jgi:hypothetical protein
LSPDTCDTDEFVATNVGILMKQLILQGGGAEGSRTPDLLIANETLYQLSYDPIQLTYKYLRHKSRNADCLLLRGSSRTDADTIGNIRSNDKQIS